MDKLWKGRITGDSDRLAESFTASINIDRDLYLYDITGTAAYVIGLNDAGIISNEELKEIIGGLKKVKEKINEFTSKLGLASKDEIDEIKKMIKDLSDKIDGKK